MSNYLITRKGEKPQTYINVTSITGLLDKPFLKVWSANLAVDYIIENGELGFCDEGYYELVTNSENLENARNAHKNRLTETADIGSELHSLIETFINIRIKHQKWREENYNDDDNPYNKKESDFLDYVFSHPPNLKQMFLQFLLWSKKNVKQFLESEKPVCHQELAYGGTLDMVYKGFDDKIYCVDLKTSNGIYKEHQLQDVSYKQARESMEGEYSIYGKTYNYPKIKIDHCGILNIERDYFNLEFKIVKDVESLTNAFNHLVGFYYCYAKRRLNNPRAVNRM